MSFQDFSLWSPTTTPAKRQPWTKEAFFIIAVLATSMTMDGLPPIHASDSPNDVSQEQKQSEGDSQDTDSEPAATHTDTPQTAIPLNHGASKSSGAQDNRGQAFGVGSEAFGGMLS